jgi:hypothetical protein
MKQMDKLKPCPCCNGEAIYSEHPQKWHYAICTNCGLRTMSFRSEEEAAKVWNTRTNDDELDKVKNEISRISYELGYNKANQEWINRIGNRIFELKKELQRLLPGKDDKTNE